MIIMKMPRRAGKTYSLITIAAERGAWIVCRDKQEAVRIFQVSLNRELTIPFPLTFHEFVNKPYLGKNIKEMLIDDVDALLVYIAGTNITYCTYTPS